MEKCQPILELKLYTKIKVDTKDIEVELVEMTLMNWSLGMLLSSANHN